MSSSSSPPSFSSVRFSFKRLFAYLLTTNQTQVMGRLLGTPRRPCQARPRHLAPHLFFSHPPAPPSPSLFLFYSFSSSSSVCLSAPCFAPGIASMGAEAGSRTYLLLLLTARPRALPARASDHVRASVEPPTFPHQTIDHPASLFTHLLSLLLSPLLPSPVWAAAFAMIAIRPPALVSQNCSPFVPLFARLRASANPCRATTATGSPPCHSCSSESLAPDPLLTAYSSSP